MKTLSWNDETKIVGHQIKVFFLKNTIVLFYFYITGIIYMSVIIFSSTVVYLLFSVDN